MVRDRAGRKSMSLAFTISDLRRRPEFFNTVAMRIWQAWWEAEGTSLDYISGRLREHERHANPVRAGRARRLFTKGWAGPCWNDKSGATAST